MSPIRITICQETIATNHQIVFSPALLAHFLSNFVTRQCTFLWTFYLFFNCRCNIELPFFQHDVVSLDLENYQDLDMAVSNHEVHLQSPGLLFGLKGHKAVPFRDPGPVLDDLCLLHIAEG